MLLSACGEGGPKPAALRRERRAPEARLLTDAAVVPASVTPSLESMWAESKLIRTAELHVEVPKVQAALDRADSMAKAREALVADVKITQDDRGRRSADVTIRVPAPRFAELLAALRGLGEVRSVTVGTEDVTKAYADLETRLAVKEETAGRLRALLANRTGKLSDVLDVERELSRVVTELEQMKGERRYYDQRIAVSSIVLNLYEAGALLHPGAAAPIGAAFRSATDVLATSVAWLVYLVTFLAPWLAVTSLLWWLRKTVRARHRAA